MDGCDKMEKIAQVLINIPAKAMNKAFSYLVPSSLHYVQEGWRVLVPFGSRKVEGFVAGITAGSGQDLKYIADVLDDVPWFDQNMLETASWISRYYLCTLVEAMRLFIPGKTGVKISLAYQLNEGLTAEQIAACLASKPAEYRDICNYLMTHGPAGFPQIHRQFPR